MTIDFQEIGNWIPIIVFFVSIFGGFWKIADTLNKTLSELRYEIRRLNEGITESKNDRIKIHSKIDIVEDKLSEHSTRITVLENTH